MNVTASWSFNETFLARFDVVSKLQPAADYMSGLIERAQPDLVWSLFYVTVLVVAYLFHSPFRSHSQATLDTYARVIRVFQTWTMTVLSVFHLMPQFMKRGRAQVSQMTEPGEVVPVIFFPTFVCLLFFFLFLHKMKRRWRMGVTYGPNLSIVILNSVVVAVVACTHLSFYSQVCKSVDTPWGRPLCVVYMSPTDVMDRPFTTFSRMWFLCIMIVLCDYLYKRYRGFDPTRGILWSELYDLKRDNEAQPTSLLPTNIDWRELVPSPEEFAKKVTDAAQNMPATMAAAAQEHSVMLPTLYREPVLEVSTERVSKAMSHMSPSTASEREVSRVPAASFAFPNVVVQEVLSAKHPVNKPGMVPWWSTFALFTAWQAVAAVSLGFLSFDVRSIERLAGPKVLNLSFTSTLRSGGVKSPSWVSGSPTSTYDGDDKDSQAADALGSTDTDTNVWFDWIADVGDGFNPTYEMARLLAQPKLVLSESRGETAQDVEESQITLDVSPPSSSDDLEGSGAPQSLFPTAAPPTKPANRPTKSTLARASSTENLARASSGETLQRATSFSGAASGKRSFCTRAPAEPLTLPRGSFTIIGGDLAYPSPDDETYQTRLFEPYRDALSGNHSLRSVFHKEQRRIVVQDEADPDLAHIRMLDAETVASIATGGHPLRKYRGSVEEALRSIPMMFAIPGNHDWFDGLSTFRKYIVEKTWIGGWLMPQRSSFFVLKLPYNWFILCCDTGNSADIDAGQRNYFLDVIEKYMDSESCVILTHHEPGWLFNAMHKATSPMQPELDRVISALCTRMRLEIAGDIHYYSRHTPSDPLSQAATLVVSGGGGAYLYGARDDKIISQGTAYMRNGAFPRNNTYMSIASRLWGFRVVNWKFDVIIGVLCFGLIVSMLPMPFNNAARNYGEVKNIPELISAWMNTTLSLCEFLFTRAVVSLAPFTLYWMCFGLAGSDRKAPLWWRVVYGLFWTMLVVFASCGMLAFLTCGMLAYMVNNDMILSTPQKWSSLMEIQIYDNMMMLLSHLSNMLGSGNILILLLKWAGTRLHGSALANVYWTLVRSLDPVEALAYLSMVVSSSEIGQFADSARRVEITGYYAYLLTFYWILVTPIVSFIIGTFLFVSVTVFDYMYDFAYSAFQIEDYKHFLRFKIDRHTRELHAYCIVEKKVPKMWELDPRHAADFNDAEQKHLPPHLRRRPSRWSPVTGRRGSKPMEAEVLESFVIKPHRMR